MYIVSYDISNNRRRGKVADLLLDYGKRVQYSVFECRISQKEFEEMYGKLVELMADADEGNIRFYHLCGKCEKEVREFGLQKKDVLDLDDIFII